MRNELLNLQLEHQAVPEEIETAIPGIFESYIDAMVSSAISAIGRAEHWRKEHPTLVGCSLLAAGKNLDLSNLALYTGANHKSEDAMLAYPERKCAEMDALEGVLNKKSDEEESKKGEGTERGDFGFVLAVVTVSENANTGEQDTAHQHILESCKQCMNNYEYLLKQGRVSKKTILCNVRLNQGKNDIKQVTIGEALEQFHEQTEVRTKNSIRDLLEVVDRQAVKPYLEMVAKINVELNPLEQKFDNYPIPSSLNKEEQDLLKERIQKEKLSLQREKTERKLEKIPFFVKIITEAMLSAFEEGVDKQRLIKSLGINGFKLDDSKEGFSSSELKSVQESVASYLSSLVP